MFFAIYLYLTEIVKQLFPSDFYFWAVLMVMLHHWYCIPDRDVVSF